MNTYIKSLKLWLEGHQKVKEWVWFVALWLGGLLTVMLIAYPIRWMIKRFF